MEMLPPLVAGVLTGVIRALALLRKENPKTLRGWRRWFVTYDRVPLVAIGMGLLVVFCALGMHRVSNIPDTVGEMLLIFVMFAIFTATAGFFFGIPIAVVVSFLIYHAGLWIDGGKIEGG